jgi:hypothetical protein
MLASSSTAFELRKNRPFNQFCLLENTFPFSSNHRSRSKNHVSSHHHQPIKEVDGMNGKKIIVERLIVINL